MTAAVIVHPRLAQASFDRAIRPLLDQPETYEGFGIKFVEYSFPFLDVDLQWRREAVWLRLRVDATNYSYRPIGGWWIDSGGNPARQGGALRLPTNKGFHLGSRADGNPSGWFCFAGWREFHDWPGHEKVSWASLRDEPQRSVLALIMQLQSELNHPEVNAT